MSSPLASLCVFPQVSLMNQKRRAVPSGDADVPKRSALGERRTAFERRAERAAAAAEDGDGGDGGGGEDVQDDEYYAAAAEAAAAKKAGKKQQYGPGRFEPVFPEEAAAAEGKRGISGGMESNRGLTPHRNKDLKNPRKKHRIKARAPAAAAAAANPHANAPLLLRTWRPGGSSGFTFLFLFARSDAGAARAQPESRAGFDTGTGGYGYR